MAVKLYVGEVAPVMSVNVVPPSVLTCHCTVGVGMPLAVAVNVAMLPALTVIDESVDTVGATASVNVAGLLVKLPRLLVNTASYSVPLTAAEAVKL